MNDKVIGIVGENIKEGETVLIDLNVGPDQIIYKAKKVFNGCQGCIGEWAAWKCDECDDYNCHSEI